MKRLLCISFLPLIIFLGCTQHQPQDEKEFAKALLIGSQAHEGFNRCLDFVYGWLNHTDSISGLIPENLTHGMDIWNAHNAAADNYSFMVLTSYILDRPLYEGRMREMLRAEKGLTARIKSLPDSYSFSRQDFQFELTDTARIIFGASEYIKDGLIPLMEYCGPSPWNDRLMEMITDLSGVIEVVDKNLFNNPTTADEVNGEMLQALSRIYWMTGEEKFMDWAVRIGDSYLLTDRNPLYSQRFRLRDHGCEILGGLSELYFLLHFIRPDKKTEYREPLVRLMDRILVIGRNEDGMFYNEINPEMSSVIDSTLVDNWGYLYNAYYTLYLLDGLDRYRKTIVESMQLLSKKYRNYPWEGTSQDGYADAIESAINLYNREPQKEVAEWIDSEIRVMWQKQQPDGIIEGWHGDGNFARTTLMYCLWKTQGVTLKPWTPGLEIGGFQGNDTLYLSLRSTTKWSGRITFDFPRHQKYLHLPIDYPRINQFPEWYTVNEGSIYRVQINPGNRSMEYQGSTLRNGLELKLGEKDSLFLKIIRVSG